MNQSQPLTSISRVCLIMAAVVIILAAVKAASVIVVPVLLALFIAIICQPVIVLFQRMGLHKVLAVISVVLVMLVLVLALAGLVVQSVNEFLQNLPVYRELMTQRFDWLAEQAETYSISLNWEFVQGQLDPSRAINLTINMLSGVGGIMTSSVIILLIVVFMLAEASITPHKLRLAFNSPDKTMGQVHSILRAVNKYLALKTLISLVTGFIVGFGLWLMGIDHYVLWGVLAFLFNYIPNIGSILAAVPAVLMAVIQFSPTMAGLVALLFLAVNMLMGNLIEPRVMGRGLGLSTLVVFLSLIFWGWILGPVGMFLSVPLTMVAKIALAENESTRWLAILLSGDEIMKVADNDSQAIEDIVTVSKQEP